MKIRRYIQARNFLKEATLNIKNYDSILSKTRKDYEGLRNTGISCNALSNKIAVTRQCWNHVFKNPNKRSAKVKKLERALCFPYAIKLLNKTTTYQEVSREKDKGGNAHLFFGVIGYIRGNRIKVIIRKQEKNTNAKYVLFSFFQMSFAPAPKTKKETE
ncbi:hypothetical protein C0416_03890 [bacterium]|nr:hypothetical protein [bacterium]